eukprot:494777_1
MASLKGFARIDFALHLYYKQMGRLDYKNEENKGKFIQFTEINDLKENEIKYELQKNATNCVYVDFDHECPLPNTNLVNPNEFTKVITDVDEITDTELSKQTIGKHSFYSKNISSKEIDNCTKGQKIFNLIKICYIYGYPKTHLPLHRFSVENICNKISDWIYNDINYEKHLNKIINIFKQKQLNGKRVINYASNDIK